MRKVHVFVVVFLLMLASSMDAQKRRSVVSDIPLRGTMSMFCATIQDGVCLAYRANLVTSSLREGAVIKAYTVSPSGLKELIPETQYVNPAQYAGWGAQAWIWPVFSAEGKPLPSSWPKTGVGKFRVEVTGTENFFMEHEVIIGDPSNETGPVKSTFVFPDGKVLVKGDFPAKPFVTIDGQRVAQIEWNGKDEILVTPMEDSFGEGKMLSVFDPKTHKNSTRRVNIPFIDRN